MRHFLLACFFALCSLTATAQLDAKLNAGAALTGGLNVAVDLGISDNFSVSAGFGRAVTSLTVDDVKYRLKRWRFVPEARYYFAPKYGADGVFAGLYGRLADIKAEADNTDNDFTTLRAAVGLLGGYKFVTESNFVFELNAGFGRGFYFNNNIEDERGKEIINQGVNWLTGIDLRLGIIVGYRFGGNY